MLRKRKDLSKKVEYIIALVGLCNYYRCFSVLKKVVYLITIISFVIGEVVPLYAGNIAMRGNGGGYVERSASGIDIVNIGKINEREVSYNEFDSLDVDERGLIFNNSGDLSKTELAGWIDGNKNIEKGKGAGIIIADVKSKRASELLGYMEIAGRRSDIIIANERGIECNGCGFINAKKGILTTGSIGFKEDGSIGNIKVKGGEIKIGERGFDASKMDGIDIISQQLRLEGEIRGNSIDISLGRQERDYGSGTSIYSEEGEEVGRTISSGYLGGIYGSSIRLMSLERGVGVNIDFDMVTRGNKIEIDSEGNLRIGSKVVGDGGVEIRGEEIELDEAEVLSNKEIKIRGEDILVQEGSKIETEKGIEVKGKGLEIRDSSIKSGEDIRIEGEEIGINNNATFGSVGDIKILGNGIKIGEGSKISGNGGVNIGVKRGIEVAGEIIAEYGAIWLEGQSNKILGKGSVLSSEGVDIKGDNNEIWGEVLSEGGIKIGGGESIIKEGGKLNSSGNKGVNIRGDKLSLEKNSEIMSGGGINIEIKGDFNAIGGINIGSKGLFSVIGSNINFYEGANIISDGGINLKGHDIVLQAGADVSSKGKIEVSGNSLVVGEGNDVSKEDNKVTLLGSNDDVEINVKNEVEVKAKGNVTSKNRLDIIADRVVNRGFIAGENIEFRVNRLSNVGSERAGNSNSSYGNMGVIYAIDSIDIKGLEQERADSIENLSAKIQAGGDISIVADSFANRVSWYSIDEIIGDWKTIYENKKTNEWWYYENDSHQYRYRDYETKKEREISYKVNGGEAAEISAEGNIKIDANNILNQSSEIISVGGIELKGQNINNETIGKQAYREEQIDIMHEKYAEHRSSGAFGQWGDWKYDYTNYTYDQHTTKQNLSFVIKDSGKIITNGALKIEASNFFGNGSRQEYAKQDIKTGEEIKDIEKGYSGNNDIVISGDVVINIDGNMFYKGEEGSKYLIETNPYFTDLEKFKSSEYFLSKLGIAPNSDNKLIGDGYVQLTVVEEQIKDFIGNQVMEGYNNSKEQMEDLMQKGMEAGEKLDLEVGKELTKEQQDSLDTPIIWWVSKEINGEEVLIPQVYFPKDYKEKDDTKGSEIKGRDVIIDAKTVENNGSIKGKDSVIITGENVYNQGSIEVDSHREELQEMVEKYNKGVVELEDKIAKNEESAKKYEDQAKRVGMIDGEYEKLLNYYNSIGSGYGNKISYYGNREKKAKLGIEEQLKSVEEKKNKEIIELAGMLGKLEEESRAIEEMQNKLKAEGESINNNNKGKLTIKGDKVENVGGEIRGDRVEIEAQHLRNVALATAKYEKYTKENKGLMGNDVMVMLFGSPSAKKRIEERLQRENQWKKVEEYDGGYQGGQIEGREAVDIKVKDVEIKGSAISGGGEVNIEAEDDINILSQEEKRNLSYEEAKGTTVVYTDINSNQLANKEIGDSGTQFLGGSEITNIGSMISGNNVNLKGNNITVKGSDMLGLESLSLKAKEDVNLIAAEDSKTIDYSVKQTQTTKSGNWYNKKSTSIEDKGKSSVSNRYTNLVGGDISIESGGDILLQGANLDTSTSDDEGNEEASKVTGLISINSGKDITIKGSAISGGGEVNIEAEDDINILSQEEKRNLSYEEAKGTTVVYTDINSNQLANKEIGDSGTQFLGGSEITNIGSFISGNNVNLSGNNIMVKASDIVAGDNLTLKAKEDVSLISAEDSKTIDYSVKQTQTTKSGKWYQKKKKTSTTIEDKGTISSVSNRYTNLMGGEISIEAGSDVLLQGASLDTSISEREGRDATGLISIKAGNEYKQLDVADRMSLRLNTDTTIVSKGMEVNTVVDNAKDSGAMIKALTKNKDSFLGQSSNAGMQVLSGVSNVANILGSIGSLSTIAGASHTTSTTKTNTKTEQEMSSSQASRIKGGDVEIEAKNIEIVAGEIEASNDISLRAKEGLSIKESYNENETKQESHSETESVTTSVSVGLTGVNGSVSATKTKTESKNSSQNRDVVGSKIKAGGNIKMEGNKVELVSAEIEGDKGVGIKAKDSIEIRSAASTRESSYESDSDSKTVSVNVGVTWGGVPTVGGGISGSKSHSEGESSSKEYAEGIIKGGEIKIETGDMKMEGGSIEGESINIKAEDVKIGSVQDEYSRRDESSEISAGISVGGSKGESGWVGNAGGNLGVGRSKSESSGKNVKEQAGIVANKQLEMEVGNKLGLNSATLGGKEGSKIEAGEIEIKEMEDSNSSKSEGYKVGGGYSFSFGGGSTQEGGSSKAGKSKGSKGVIGSINSVRDGVYNVGGYIADVKVEMNKREIGEISKINSSVGREVGIESNKIIIDNEDMGIDSINRDVENNRTEISSYDSGYNLEIAPKQWTNNLGGALGTTSDYIKAGGETVKVGIKASGEIRGWFNHIGFGKVYGELNIVDEVQKESRKEGINIIANGKEYGKLVKDKGYTDEEVETVVYAMEADGRWGYSQENSSEIGINLEKKGGEIVSGGEIENTMWHELTHQREREEETRYNREDHAKIIGSSAEILGGVNNWMYGDGGLNSGSINSYYNTNLANGNLGNNNAYVLLNAQNNTEDKDYMFGRPLDTEALAWGFGHRGIIITGDKEYLEKFHLLDKNLNKVEPLKITEAMEGKGISKEDGDYFITIAGYKDKYLTKNINDASDLKYIYGGDFEHVEIATINQSQEETDRKIVDSYKAYNNFAFYPKSGMPNDEYNVFLFSTRSPTYSLLNGIITLPQRVLYGRNPESMQTYNSNSFALTTCSRGGGINCRKEFSLVYPGMYKFIPETYFNLQVNR